MYTAFLKKVSVSNPLEVTETVYKPFQPFLGGDVGVKADITFPTAKLHCCPDDKSKDKNSNYYNPYSHNHRL